MVEEVEEGLLEEGGGGRGVRGKRRSRRTRSIIEWEETCVVER